MSEPFLKAPSYFNCSGYNYPSKEVMEENNEETDCEKVKSKSVLNEYDNNCIPLKGIILQVIWCIVRSV